MVTLQSQARAQGDPTRYEIFRCITYAARPVDVAELTDQVGLNHNAIRQHLAKLVDAELVDESWVSRHGRGWPKLVYSVRPTTESRWGATGSYERLSALLAEVLRTGDSPEEMGRRSVQPRRLGAVEDPVDPLGIFVVAMARRGFDPETRVRGRSVEIVLRACPFATTALVDPETVCGLHLGIALGVADSTGGRLTVDELVPDDPRRARCRLWVRLEAEGRP